MMKSHTTIISTSQHDGGLKSRFDAKTYQII